MAAIVPPQGTPNQQRIMRRVKAYRCAQWCMAFCLFAVAALVARLELRASLSIWAQLIGVASAGMAAVAATGAVVYRIVETPREVAVRSPFDWPRDPPVLWLKRKE